MLLGNVLSDDVVQSIQLLLISTNVYGVFVCYSSVFFFFFEGGKGYLSSYLAHWYVRTVAGMRHLAAEGTICIWMMLMVLVDGDLNVKTDSSKQK